ncbi:hypothetical protein [uncultured Aquitalea sp.]|uniref:AbrB/MazE/SpoVT family DNA-binding domain-containing protein n=1 Tax=uncultured Aquitalea sp. TaxID=540272 RepID=UPI0025E8EAA5|nr:hypothetical protein [uncultured Aquitalea sp.]
MIEEKICCDMSACVRSLSVPAQCIQNLKSLPVADRFEKIMSCIALLLSEVHGMTLRNCANVFANDLIKALIVLEVGNQPQEKHLVYRHRGPLPRFCNIHSLSQAIGVPRETVRRKVMQLEREDWIVRLEDGGLVLAPARAATFKVESLMRQVSFIDMTMEKIRTLRSLLPVVSSLTAGQA